MSREKIFQMPRRPPQIPLVGVDRLGKLIEPGHLVMFHPGEDLIFEVVSAGPVLNPAIQGGKGFQVVLSATFPVQFMPATPNRGMVIVGESKARIEAKAANNGQGAVVPADEGTGIELTDADLGDTSVGVDDTPEEHPADGPCGSCGGVGPVGTACDECGTGIHGPQQG